MQELNSKETYKPAASSILHCPRCRATYPIGDTCPICQPVASPTGYSPYGAFYVLPAIKTRALRGKDQPERPIGVRRPLTLLPIGIVLLLTIACAGVFSLLPHGRFNCAGCCIECGPTYTVPPLPTATPLLQSASPDQLVQYFLIVYSDSTDHYARLQGLFDTTYAHVASSVFPCAMDSVRQSFGPIASDYSLIEQPVITGTVASVVAYLSTPLRNDDTTFYLQHEQGGWKIDRIIGWVGGDITPANPVGEIQSCLQATPDAYLQP
jgi:hypothetical protein